MSSFINRVFDTVANREVAWRSGRVPDPGGTYYPGPGTFGDDTVGFAVSGPKAKPGKIYDVTEFGAFGNGLVDDIAAFERAIAAIKEEGIYGAQLRIPAGPYFLSRAWRVDHHVSIVGDFGSGDRPATRLTFASGSNGIIFEGPTTSSSGGSAQWSTLSDVGIYSQGNGSRTPRALTIRTRVSVYRPFLQGFADTVAVTQSDFAWATSKDVRVGDLASNSGNVYACRVGGTTASSGSGPTGTGTNIADGSTVRWDRVDATTIIANHVEVHNSRSQNHTRYAIHLQGSDSNTAVIFHPDCVGGTIGYLDESFFGAVWFMPEVSGTSVHPYANNLSGTNFNQSGCHWFMPYTEGDQPGAYVSAPAKHTPGLEAAGWASGSIRPVQRFQTTANVESQSGATHYTVPGDAVSGYGTEFVRVGRDAGANDGAVLGLYGSDSAGVPLQLRHTNRLYSHFWTMNYSADDVFHAWGFASVQGKVGNRRVPPGMFAFNGGYGFYVGQNRVMFLDALPSSGSGPHGQGKWWDFYQGDTIFLHNTTPNAAESYRVLTDGTAGTYTEGRTATANGTTTVTLNSATLILTEGNWVTINGVTARINTIAPDGITLTMSASITTGSGLAIAYRAPVFYDNAAASSDTFFNVKRFGAKGDGSTDDIAAFDACMSAMASAGTPTGAVFVIPPGTYRLSRPFHVRRSCRILGAHAWGDYASSTLKFDAGQHGVIIDSLYSSTDGGTGAWSVIENIGITGTTQSGRGNGVIFRDRALCKNVRLSFFGNNGFHVRSDSDSNWAISTGYIEGDIVSNDGGKYYVCITPGTSAGSGGPTGTGSNITDGTAHWKYVSNSNCNGWGIENCRVVDCGDGTTTGNGLFVRGSNSNAGHCSGLDVAGVPGWGVLEESFLGNTYEHCQVATCDTGAYGANVSLGNYNQRNIFINCYSESDCPMSYGTNPTLFLWGLHGAPISGTAAIMVDNGSGDAPMLMTPTRFKVSASNFGDPAWQLLIGSQNVGTEQSGYFMQLFGGGEFEGFRYASRMLGTPAYSVNWSTADGYDGWGWSAPATRLSSGGGTRQPASPSFLISEAHGFYIGPNRITTAAAMPSAADGPFVDGKFWDWYVGDVLINRTGTSGVAFAWQCSANGTAGTYSEGRTATANGTSVIVLSSASTVLNVGNYITVNSTTRRIDIISGTSVTLSGTVSAGSGLAITYAAPAFLPIGVVGATVSSATPQLLANTASAGSSLDWSRADHAHSNSFVKPYRTSSSATPTAVSNTDWNGSLECTAAGNIDVAFNSSFCVTGAEVSLKKMNAGTNTFSITPPAGVAVVQEGSTGTVATSTPLTDGASTAQPEWMVRFNGTNLVVS